MSVTRDLSTEPSPSAFRKRSKFSAIAICALFTGALGTSTAVAVAASPACGEFVRSYVDRIERNAVSPATLRRWREWGVKHPHWHPSPHVAKRPKFKKVREEKLSRMQVDCQVLTPEIPLLTAALDTFLFAPSEPAAPAFEQALNAPITAPLQAFRAPSAGSSIAGIRAPSVGGIGGGGVSAPSGGGPVSTTPPAGSTPISNPVAITPIAPITSTPISDPIAIIPIAPITSTPISDPVPITPINPVTPAPVPEPNSVILTLTGMGAIAAFSIFRRKQPGYRHSS